MLNNLTRTRGCLLLPLLVVLAGCYEEQDVVTISSDGLVHFESTVTVKDTDKKMSPEAMQQTAERVVSDLQRAKWNVEMAWISKERPYRMTFSGEGKLADIESATSFYRLKRVDDKTYTISFLMPGNEGEKSIRSIVFKSTRGQAEVIDRKGNPVLKIASVSESDLYGIKLP